MNKINKHDKELSNKMIELLIAFEQKKIELFYLVINLESYYHEIKHTTDEFNEKIFKQLIILESINAEMPDINKNEIDKIIDYASNELKKIILTYVNG